MGKKALPSVQFIVDHRNLSKMPSKNLSNISMRLARDNTRLCGDVNIAPFWTQRAV